MEGALDSLSISDSALDAALVAACSSGLTASSGQTQENAANLLHVAAKSFPISLDKLVNAASQQGTRADWFIQPSKGLSVWQQRGWHRPQETLLIVLKLSLLPFQKIYKLKF